MGRRTLPLAVAFVGVIGILFGLRAQAMAQTELCPARVNVPFAGYPYAGPSEYFGLALEAASARDVSADVVFQTDRGWFKLRIQNAELALTTRHFDAGNSVKQWSVASSQIYFVKFPTPVNILDTWVTDATSNDPAWASSGTVQCDPEQDDLTEYRGLRGRAPIYLQPLVPKELAAFYPQKSDLPNATDAISIPPPVLQTGPSLQAGRIQTDPAPASCPSSSQATVTHTVDPVWPKGAPAVHVTVLVQVTIAADGHLTNALIYRSSGDQRFDQAAIDAARAFTYAPATLHCHHVMSTAIIQAEFQAPISI